MRDPSAVLRSLAAFLTGLLRRNRRKWAPLSSQGPSALMASVRARIVARNLDRAARRVEKRRRKARRFVPADPIESRE